jgi:hypothetical protein
VNVVTVANKALTRRAGGLIRARRPELRLALLDTALALSSRKRAVEPAQARRRKVMSVEFELAGLAVELKAKSLTGLVTWLSLDVAIAAVVQELMRPRQFRTWHGRVAGLVPYDFRKPSLRRLLGALWAPDNPRLFTDTAFGVGWSVNLAQVPKALFGISRPARPKTYDAPRVTSPR